VDAELKSEQKTSEVSSDRFEKVWKMFEEVDSLDAQPEPENIRRAVEKSENILEPNEDTCNSMSIQKISAQSEICN